MKFAKILAVVVAALALTFTTSCGKKKQVETTAPTPGYVEYGK